VAEPAAEVQVRRPLGSPLIVKRDYAGDPRDLARDEDGGYVDVVAPRRKLLLQHGAGLGIEDVINPGLAEVSLGEAARNSGCGRHGEVPAFTILEVQIGVEPDQTR